MDMTAEAGRVACIERLRQAINRHDVDAMAHCFDPDYESLFPAHPDRAFRGHEQMRKNWSRIFAALPDMHAELVRCAADGDTVWAEWEWGGTRPDGVPMAQRGVTIQGIPEQRIAWVRLYMEPVQHGTGTDAAVGASIDSGRRP